ncbi:MAG: four helix bundle protein [Deltaproteobacteria bacterium]|nr:four helix bundle protein [Deltaproteobacteria bacterium]
MKIESRPSGKDIEAWQLARELPRRVYGLTKKAKFARDFGLKGQIQDAAGSYKWFRDSRFGVSEG